MFFLGFYPVGDMARSYTELDPDDLMNMNDSDEAMDALDYETEFFKNLPGNFPQPTMLSPEEVESKADYYVTSIFSVQRTLVDVLDRHESTLIKRWLKKAIAQWHKVLMAAFPGIPAVHRPNFYALRMESTD